LGYTVARGTIANVLKKQGIEPAPERGKKTTWKELLRAHWNVIAAAHFFTVEVWTLRGYCQVEQKYADQLRVAGYHTVNLGS
jgi:hypothetical protein